VTDYYNTNEESGDTLSHSEQQARMQQTLVLAFFQARPLRRFAPHEVHRSMPEGTPLTSTRRAITNLTTQGHLEKTQEMRPGTFGKQVHTWQLTTTPLQRAQQMLAEQLARHRNQM